MPAPQRTSLDQIVREASAILDERGLDGLTMHAVADAVGVRAPSLYKRVRDRNHLIALVTEAVVDALGEDLDRAVSVPGLAPRTALRALADAFRAFAHARPAGCALIFMRLPPAARPEAEVLRRGSAAVFRVAAALAGERDALEAARMITAWAHGFVDMELSGAFRLGGDADRAYRYGIDRLADALTGGLRESLTGS